MPSSTQARGMLLTRQRRIPVGTTPSAQWQHARVDSFRSRSDPSCGTVRWLQHAGAMPRPSCLRLAVPLALSASRISSPLRRRICPRPTCQITPVRSFGSWWWSWLTTSRQLHVILCTLHSPALHSPRSLTFRAPCAPPLRRTGSVQNLTTSWTPVPTSTSRATSGPGHERPLMLSGPAKGCGFTFSPHGAGAGMTSSSILTWTRLWGRARSQGKPRWGTSTCPDLRCCGVRDWHRQGRGWERSADGLGRSPPL